MPRELLPSTAQRSRRGERGLTILELVVALSIAGLTGLLLFAIWTFTLSFAKRGGVEVEAQQFGRIALATMVRELREALAGEDTIATWSTANEAPVDAIGFVSARDEVSGRPFGTDRDGNPTWRVAVYYVHDRAGGVLRRFAQPWEGALTVPSTDEGRVVTRGVKEVRFDRQGDLVTITLRVAAGRREIILETAVLPRN